MKKLIATLAIGACFIAGSLNAQVSPGGVYTGQKTCTSTPSILVTAEPGRLHVIVIEQLSTTQFYIGKSTVTTANGLPIPGTINASFSVSSQAEIWCVTSSGTATVAIWATL